MAEKILKISGVAIVLFILVYYYTGSTSVISTLSNSASKFAGTLVGRDQNGNLPSSYPSLGNS
ncbi:hypothetical protein SBF1_5870006 [Candidatus Desulfosporosinus infrequens]|uniref:Uncharacterized protein n=1 Tax=Candidatus Desulfosporosinus infrequens TaxID=2043169 RepID=A0A2U3LKU1_9FIRM|nr:hypothetical protein SBF1_5870006 [Candidatus Desulfosporosinus infrequens]